MTSIYPVKNYRLYLTRLESGLRQIDLSKELGVSNSTYEHIENMKTRPRQSVKTKLSKMLNKPESYLFPESLDNHYSKHKESSDAMDCRERKEFSDPTYEPNMTEQLQQEELKENISELLNKIHPREREIIKLRYGLGPENQSLTYREIGPKLKLGIERIRSIEGRGIRRLQHYAELHNLNEHFF